MENFGYVFSKALEGLFIDRMDQNEEITAKFMNEDRFREAVSTFLKKCTIRSGRRPKSQMTNDEIARFFNDTQAFIQGNSDLRAPQVEGWFRTCQHFRNSSEHTILQIPHNCHENMVFSKRLHQVYVSSTLVAGGIK